MLEKLTQAQYKRQTPDALVMQGWRFNQVRSSPAMAKPYFRSNYAEVKTQHEGPFWHCVCIPLIGGHHALIDTCDYEIVSSFWWYPRVVLRNIYAAAWKKGGGNLSMHVAIMPHDGTGRIRDHINRNGLDNRRSNLRWASLSLNNANSRERKNKSSQYRGVYWHKRDKRWIASMGKYQVGRFKDEIEAAKTYDRKALELYGEFATLNFPKPPTTESQS